MKSFTKTLAVATVTAAALTLPSAAFANDYRKCSDTENAVAGGLIGGSLGTILGEEVAGRGNRTEGAIAGAVIGGVLGAAIGDGVSDCEKDGKIYRNGRVIGTYSGYQTVSHPHGYNNRRHNSDRRHYNDRRDHYNRGRDRGQNYNQGRHRGNVYTARQHDQDLRRIDRRMDQLRAERENLKRRGYYQNRRGVERRLREIAYELDRLKNERDRVKRLWDQSKRQNNHYRYRR